MTSVNNPMIANGCLLTIPLIRLIVIFIKPLVYSKNIANAPTKHIVNITIYGMDEDIGAQTNTKYINGKNK
jgi:hypothetical protein